MQELNTGNHCISCLGISPIIHTNPNPIFPAWTKGQRCKNQYLLNACINCKENVLGSGSSRTVPTSPGGVIKPGWSCLENLPWESSLGILGLQEPPPAAATNSGNREFHGPGWNGPRASQGFAPQIIPCSQGTTHSLSCGRSLGDFHGIKALFVQCEELKMWIWGFFFMQ